jgi:hypothetical protein
MSQHIRDSFGHYSTAPKYSHWDNQWIRGNSTFTNSKYLSYRGKEHNWKTDKMYWGFYREHLANQRADAKRRAYKYQWMKKLYGGAQTTTKQLTNPYRRR